MRYNSYLETLRIMLYPSGIRLLVHVSAIPAFRERINTLRLCTPELYASDDSARDTDAHGTTNVSSKADLEKLIESKEMVNLLAKCFNNLSGTVTLSSITLVGSQGHSLVMRAISKACFSTKLVHLQIEPAHLAKDGYGAFSRAPEKFVHYIKGLSVQTNLHGAHLSINTYTHDEKKENAIGLHLKNYRPSHPILSNLLSALVDIERLEIYGCRSQPELRLCHGCDDLFVKNFSTLIYSQLKSLSIERMYISGSRLRRFIKRHGHTLSNIKLSYTMLTDGTWRSIGQGMMKLPFLQNIRLDSLRQKSSATWVTRDYERPSEYASCSEVNIKDALYIQHFLDVFVTCFDTTLYLNQHRLSKQYPKYYQVKLFRLPGYSHSVDHGLASKMASEFSPQTYQSR